MQDETDAREPFLDQANMTSEQKFMLMLLERVEKIEAKLSEEFPPKKVLRPEVTTLYDRLDQLEQRMISEDHVVLRQKLVDLGVPHGALDSVPNDWLCSLYSMHFYTYPLIYKSAMELLRCAPKINDELLAYIQKMFFGKN